MQPRDTPSAAALRTPHKYKNREDHALPDKSQPLAEGPVCCTSGWRLASAYVRPPWVGLGSPVPAWPGSPCALVAPSSLIYTTARGSSEPAPILKVQTAAEGMLATAPKVWAICILRSLPTENDSVPSDGRRDHVCSPRGMVGSAPGSGCSLTGEKPRDQFGPTPLQAEMCSGPGERDTRSQGHRILLSPEMAALPCLS